MDSRTRGLAMASKIRFDFVHVLGAAKELEQRHLSGPSAAQVLAQGLVAAALLSSDLGAADERISLQVKVDGPVEGVVAEASENGDLRAYTHMKVLNTFDGDSLDDLAPVLGQNGTLSVIQSNSKAVLASGQVRLGRPANLRAGLAKYYNESMQVPTAVSLFSATEEGYLSHAAGLVAQKMPDGDTETFVRVLERFEDRSVCKRLSSADGLAAFAELFELDDLSVQSHQTLQFGCTCNQEKILDAIRSLSKADLQDIVNGGGGQQVTCHFCGETYLVGHDVIQTVLAAKKD